MKVNSKSKKSFFRKKSVNLWSPCGSNFQEKLINPQFFRWWHHWKFRVANIVTNILHSKCCNAEIFFCFIDRAHPSLWCSAFYATCSFSGTFFEGIWGKRLLQIILFCQKYFASCWFECLEVIKLKNMICIIGKNIDSLYFNEMCGYIHFISYPNLD